MKRKKFSTVDDYIASFPESMQIRLHQIRKIIKSSAPKAEELISYNIAGYKYHGMLIYFAGFKSHISIYPAPRQHELFKKELAAFKGGKGTLQFPHDKPLPIGLVKKIVQFRKKQNEKKVERGLKKENK
jgi:uncharacterized protein YdhG (YjbR/CyaY superfamily)